MINPRLLFTCIFYLLRISFIFILTDGYFVLLEQKLYLIHNYYNMSEPRHETTCENKDTDQLRSNCKADQRLCFRYTDNTIPLLPKSAISSFQRPSVGAQASLCQTWLEIPKTIFLASQLMFSVAYLHLLYLRH